ncbi:MAG: hypothetical protein Q7R83_01620, partial [bacterium]|nr:hypothetical protein [bacterium]
PNNAITDAMVVDALTISGGTINNTSIGASVASTGIFTYTTTTSATSTDLFATTGRFTTATSTDLYTNNLTAGAISLPNNAITDAMVVDALTISGGTINNTPIGASVASTGIFTYTTTTSATSTDFYSTTARFASVTSTDLFATTGRFTTATSTDLYTNNLTAGAISLPNNAITDAMVVDTLTISGGTIHNTPIGDSTPTGASTGIFTYTTTTAATSTDFYSTTARFASVTSTDLFATTGRFTTATSTDLYTNNLTAGAITLPNNAITDAMTVDTLTISGGTIDNTPIGASIASTAIFTDTTSTNATSTNFFAGLLGFTTATGTTLNANTMVAGDLTVAGQNVCLADGTNCAPADEVDTLLSVTNRGNYATSSVVFYGGVTTSLLTVTSTANFSNNLANLYTSDTAPASVGSITLTSQLMNDIRVFGRRAYTIDYNLNKLTILDVGDKTSPQVAGSFGLAGSPVGFDVAGSYVYYTRSSLFYVVDVSNPTSSRQMSSVTHGNAARGVSVLGKYAYVAGTGGDSKARLFVNDISNPSAVVNTVTYDTGIASTGGYHVYARGGYAFMTVEKSDLSAAYLHIVDIRNPAVPVVASSVTLDSTATGTTSLFVNGDFLYLTIKGSANVMQIYNIKDPSDPTFVSSLSLPFSPEKVRVAGRYAYLASVEYTGSGGGFYVVDVGDPTSPTLLYSKNTTPALSLDFSGKHLYLAELSGVVRIYDMTGIETKGLLAHSASIGGLQVDTNAFIGNQLVAGGATIGEGGLLVNGVAGLATSTITDLTITTVSGAGLSSCTGAFQKLQWDSTTKQFSCASEKAYSVIKSSDQPATQSSTVFQNDSELKITLAANKTYMVEAWIPIDTTNPTADLNYSFKVPSAAIMNLMTNNYTADTTAPFCNIVTNDQVCANIINVAYNFVQVHGFVETGANTGDIQFRFSQKGSVAASFPVVKTGATLSVIPVSGADLAELYYTNDSTVAPGDVVVMDPSIQAGVKLTTTPYDRSTLGVISTKPGLIIGEHTGSGGLPVAVALSGRVPVKVTTKNGSIKAGDYLTTSDLPGVAMKATKAGIAIGQALTAFEGPGEGTVVVFIKNTNYTGDFVGDVAVARTSLESLADMAVLRESQPISAVSQIATDNVYAAVSIVSPEITTQTLTASMIASGELKMDLSSGALQIGNASVTSSIVLDVQGNASFSGELVADRIRAREIVGLDVMQSSLDTLLAFASSTQYAASSTADSLSSFDGRVLSLETLFASGASSSLQLADIIASEDLAFAHVTVFDGGLRTDTIGSIGTLLTLMSDTYFFGRPYFNADTAGFALIKKGEQSVDVVFTQEYLTPPIVSITVTMDQATGTEMLTATSTAEKFFAEDIRSLVVNKTTKGFTIVLNKPVAQPVQFSWIALAVKDAKIFASPSSTSSPAAIMPPAENSDGQESVNEEPTPIVDPVVSPPEEAPVADGTVDSTSQPAVTEPVVEPVTEPVVEPIVEPVVEPVVEPATEPVVEPVVEAPVVEAPVVVESPVVEPIAPPVDEPAAP